ncbi:hypothetical protein CLOM_g11680, partial [Closterium sp. NIES-68]
QGVELQEHGQAGGVQGQVGGLQGQGLGLHEQDLRLQGQSLSTAQWQLLDQFGLQSTPGVHSGLPRTSQSATQGSGLGSGLGSLVPASLQPSDVQQLALLLQLSQQQQRFSDLPLRPQEQHQQQRRHQHQNQQQQQQQHQQQQQPLGSLPWRHPILQLPQLPVLEPQQHPSFQAQQPPPALLQHQPPNITQPSAVSSLQQDQLLLQLLAPYQPSRIGETSQSGLLSNQLQQQRQQQQQMRPLFRQPSLPASIRPVGTPSLPRFASLPPRMPPPPPHIAQMLPFEPILFSPQLLTGSNGFSVIAKWMLVCWQRFRQRPWPLQQEQSRRCQQQHQRLKQQQGGSSDSGSCSSSSSSSSS